jgi:carbon-monoxide dehydrogenase iron sulfur subunit
MIRINPEKCTGCIRCEVSCSFFHTGRVGRSRARVKVVKIEELGIDYPVICRQCEERYCARCPESAIEIGGQGQMIISPTLCTACGTCEALCPIGAIELYEDIPYVCDLCGGEPRCVQQCNMGAIEYTPGTEESNSLKAYKKRSQGLTPEEKRLRYALDMTQSLRDEWKAMIGG